MESLSMNKILNDVKMHIEGSTTDTHFDSLLVNYINTAFAILYQIGVGPTGEPFTIDENGDYEWEDFLDGPSLEMTKEYIYRRVQLMFDPPQNNNVMEASKDIMSEMEWRINAYSDYKDSFK